MPMTDADKGHAVMEAFRFFRLTTKVRMTLRMLSAYFEENDLDLENMETGLNYTRLQGWTEYGPKQSSVLTDSGHRFLH